MKQYAIRKDTNECNLMIGVNALLSKGWVLYGNLVVTNIPVFHLSSGSGGTPINREAMQYTQALTLNVPDEIRFV